VGRSTPGGGGQGATTGGGLPQDGQANFASNIDLLGGDSMVIDSRGVSRENAFRELAMMASFDTSEMVLAAASKADDTGIPNVETRGDLLVDRPYTVWGHGSYTKVENDRNRTNDDSRYDGDVWGYNVGMDYRFRDNLYGGVSIGYSETALSTLYNSGTYDETNGSVTPYAVYNLTDQLKVSVLGGYSSGNLDQTRNTGSVTSSTDTSMWFVGANASYKVQPSATLPVDMTARLGVLASHKVVDAYAESDGTQVAKATSNIRQLKPGVEAAYSYDANGTLIQPFAKVDFVYDLKDTTNADTNAYDVGGGVRIGNGAKGISGAVEGQTQLGRSDYKEYSFSGMLAYGFALDGQGGAPAGIAQPFVKSDFTGNAQTYATGVTYAAGSGQMTADLNLSRTVPQAAVAGTTAAVLKMHMNF